MKIDTSIKGFFEALLYVVTSFYVWIESTGLNTYVLAVLAFFMVLDMILGWCKASRLNDLENPSSKKAKKGILAKSVMFVIPVVVGLIWGAFGGKETAIRIVNIQLTGLMIAEGYSNIGNAYAIYTGEVLSEFDAITYLFKLTAKKIRFLLSKIFGEDEIGIND